MILVNYAQPSFSIILVYLDELDSEARYSTQEVILNTK